MSFRWTTSDKRYLLFNAIEGQSWPHLFMDLGGVKTRINKWCENPEDAWVYEVVITDTGPMLERIKL